MNTILAEGGVNFHEAVDENRAKGSDADSTSTSTATGKATARNEALLNQVKHLTEDFYLSKIS